MARSKDELKKLIDKYKYSDEPNLTDAELQDRLGQYQEISGLNQPEAIDQNALENEIANRFRQYGQRDLGGDLVKTLAGAIIANNGVVPEPLLNPEFLTDQGYKDAGGVQRKSMVSELLGTDKLGGKELLPVYQILNDQLRHGGFRPQQADYGMDVQRIQDLLATRGSNAAADSEAQASLASLPGELAKGTNAYLQGEQGRAGQYLEEQLAPEIAQSANVRGMLYSGDLANELSRGAAGVQGDLESQRAQLEAQDRNFYVNAAYNFTLNKTLQSGADLQAGVANSREQARQGQEYNFQAGRANQERALQERLMTQQQQRALYSQDAQAKRQKDLQDKQNRAALASGIGSSVGAIGGAALGSFVPVIGTGAGAYVGSQAGGQVGGLFQ